jgi:hypothetical protein
VEELVSIRGLSCSGCLIDRLGIDMLHQTLNLKDTYILVLLGLEPAHGLGCHRNHLGLIRVEGVNFIFSLQFGICLFVISLELRPIYQNAPL